MFLFHTLAAAVLGGPVVVLFLAFLFLLPSLLVLWLSLSLFWAVVAVVTALSASTSLFAASRAQRVFRGSRPASVFSNTQHHASVFSNLQRGCAGCCCCCCCCGCPYGHLQNQRSTAACGTRAECHSKEACLWSNLWTNPQQYKICDETIMRQL